VDFDDDVSTVVVDVNRVDVTRVSAETGDEE
jgi:hypothetical protein